MINENLNLKANYPFLLKPVGKDYLWGGQRLNFDYAKEIDMSPLAETWECSIHPDGLSIIDSGVYKGKTLKWLLETHPEMCGRRYRNPDLFPILIKFIDANKDLSVQVHPSDEYAKANEFGQNGKTEMWYVIDAAPGSYITYGLKHTVSKTEILELIEKNQLENVLQRVPVKANDVFFVTPGTIHAIGAGILIAEVQENSNLTYRLYDYNRTDADGNKRVLHIDKALDVADLSVNGEPVQPMRVLKYRPGCAVELLCRCKYFQVERMLVNTERIKDMLAFNSDGLSFKIFMCINGCGVLICDEISIPFFRGDSFFIPANSDDFKIHGKATLLVVTC